MTLFKVNLREITTYTKHRVENPSLWVMLTIKKYEHRKPVTLIVQTRAGSL